MLSAHYPHRTSRSRKRCSPRSATPRTKITPVRSRRTSSLSSRRGGRRLQQRSATNLGELLCFYDFPAEHWIHLKTSNPIESTFATVRHRTKVTKGPGSRAAGLAMAFKLIEVAEDHCRAINGAKLVPLVRTGATFRKGVLVESSLQEEEVAA